MDSQVIDMDLNDHIEMEPTDSKERMEERPDSNS